MIFMMILQVGGKNTTLGSGSHMCSVALLPDELKGSVTNGNY